MTDYTPTREESIGKIADLIQDIRFAMLTTLSLEGHLHSRPMTLQEASFDGTLWFFTGLSSPLVAEVGAHSEVNLGLSDPDSQSYVSLCGSARVVDDPAKERELWKPALRAWFPRGLEDPDLTLLRIDIHHVQYWDSPEAKVVQLLGMAKAMLTGHSYRGGESGKIDLSAGR